MVQAGAGGVGHVGIQIAKQHGCKVLTTASSEEGTEMCRKLGADVIINYKQEDIATHRIEHRVTIGDNFGEIHRIVIDDLIGTETADMIMVTGTGRCDDIRPYMLGKLYGKTRNTAGAALDQNFFSGL